MISLLNYLSNNQTHILEFLNSGNPERAVKYIKSKFPEFYKVEYGVNSDFMKGFIEDNQINSHDAIFAFMKESNEEYKKYFANKKEHKTEDYQKFETEYFDKLNNKLNHINWYVNSWSFVKGSQIGRYNLPTGVLCFILSPLASLKKTKGKIAYHVTTKELYEKIIKKKGLRTKGVYQKDETVEEVINKCNDIDGNKKKYHQTQNHVSYSPRIFVTLSKSKKILLQIMELQTQCIKGGGLAKYEPIVLKIDLTKHNLDLYSDQHNPKEIQAYFTLTNIPPEMISVDEKFTEILKNYYKEIETFNKEGFKYIDKLKEKSKTFAKFLNDNFDESMLAFYQRYGYGKSGISDLKTLTNIICDYNCDIEEYMNKTKKLTDLGNLFNRITDSLKKSFSKDKDDFIKFAYYKLSQIVKVFNNNEWNDNNIIDKNLDYKKICDELGFNFINKL